MRIIPITISIFFCLSTNAAQLTAEGTAGQFSSNIHYSGAYAFQVQTGMSCKVNSGTSAGVTLEANYTAQGGGSALVDCDGSPTWSPPVRPFSLLPSVPFTLKNSQSNPVSVNISYGIHGSSGVWKEIGAYIVPAKSVCNIDYLSSAEFTTSVNIAPGPIKILTSGKGNGLIQITSLYTNNALGPVMTSGSKNIPIGIKTNSIDAWNSAKGMWEGTNQNDYVLHFDNPESGGRYTGMLTVTLSCA